MRKTAIHTRQPHDQRQGVALILALLFIVLLTAIVVEFSYETQIEASFAMNQGSDFHAYIAAKSAIAQGMALLAEDELAIDDPLNPNATLQQASSDQFDGATDNWAVGVPFQPLNQATMRTTVSDEYGKINLNALLFAQEGQEPAFNEKLIESVRFLLLNRLSDASGLDAEPDQVDMIIDGILDWLDYNDEEDMLEDGAENDYYLSLENPYPCKNGPMDTIEELLLIRGMTPEIYFGVDTETVIQVPLSEFLTVHGDWTGRMNVNTMQYETILAVCEAYNINPEGILERRFNDPDGIGAFLQQNEIDALAGSNNNPTQDQPTGTNDPPPDPDDPPILRQGSPFVVHSNVFRIYGDGRHDNILVRIEAYVMRIPQGDTGSGNAVPEIPPIAESLQLGNELQVNEQFRILDWKVIR